MITAQQFCDKYEIGLSALYASRCKRLVPACSFKLQDKLLYIDEEFFIRRREFAKMVTNYNQSFYYYLENKQSTWSIARAINDLTGCNTQTMNSYLGNQMWFRDMKSIIDYKLGLSQWQAYKYFRGLARKLSKEQGKKFDVEYELDKLMEEVG